MDLNEPPTPQVARPPATNLSLEVVAGPARGSRISLAEPTFTIGGAENGDGRLGNDSEIAGRHAQIEVLPDRGLLVEDLRSGLGTYVNGVRIPAPTLVRPGDTISVGTTTMRIIDEPPPPAVLIDEPPPPPPAVVIDEPLPPPAVEPPVPPARIAALRVIAGWAPGAIIPVRNGPVVLGRTPTGAPAFEGDPAIAEQHARLSAYPDGRVLLEDLGSQTGTLVNGLRIPAPTLLAPGQRFQIGGSTLEIVEAAGDLAEPFPGDGAALGGVRQVPEALFDLIGLRAPVPRREFQRLLVITFALGLALNVLIRETAIGYLGVADNLRALQPGPLVAATVIQIAANGFGFYKIFRRPQDQSLKRYLTPTLIVPIVFLAVNFLRLNHHGGWDIAVTTVVTVLPIALCAAVMLGLRAEIARALVAAARGVPPLTRAERDIRVAPPMPTLTVTAGPAVGRSLEVAGDIVIGRGDVDLAIDDEELSRRHVVVRPIDGGVVIEDLGSTNGSWLNGERITGAVVLTRTGVLRVGKSEIRVEVGRTDATVVSETPSEFRPSDATVIRETPREFGAVGSPDDTRVRTRPGAPTQMPPERAPAPPLPTAAEQPAPAAAAVARQPAPKTALQERLPLILGVVVVAAVIAPLIAAQRDGSSKTRRLSATLDLSTVSRQLDRRVLAGTQSGPPLGSGAVTSDEVFQPGGSTGNKTAIPVSGKLITRSNNGSVTSVLQLTATRGSDSSIRFAGRGTVVGGTGEFDGASGSFRYEATQPPGSESVTATLNGTLKY